MGNRKTETTNNGTSGSAINNPPQTVDYAYDARDRLTQAGNRIFEWDQNGNLVSKSEEATYTWDYENRLKRVLMTNGTMIEYTYDVDGNRTQTKTTVNGQLSTINYLVDIAGTFSQVIAETDASNKLTALYIRGNDLLSVMRPVIFDENTNPLTWQTRFYHADGLGSVRVLTDENGSITDTYTYTAFGELVSHQDSDIQPYAFTGEALDPHTGFQYHRARWLDAGFGHWASMDSWEGNMYDPPSLHRYTYTNNNPVNSTDPSGLFSLPSISLTFFIQSALVSMAIAAPFRLWQAAKEIQAGANIGTIALDVAVDLLYEGVVGGVLACIGVAAFKYAPRIFPVSQGISKIKRAADSVWNLAARERGLAIERLILGGPGRNVRVGEAVYDDFIEGVAASVKSIDLSAKSYQSVSSITSLLSKYARDMATYSFNLSSQAAAADVKQRVLIIAIEEGAAAWQVNALTNFIRMARNVWPHLKILPIAVP